MANTFPYLSDVALMKRYDRIRSMKMADRNRFKPNPRGDEYLTREERYNELLWLLEPAIRDRLEGPHR